MKPFYKTDYNTIYLGNCEDVLKELPMDSVNCVITSPPYFQLRNYENNDNQIGLEETPKQYVDSLMKVFRQVKRVLKPNGIFFLNLGDTYSGGNRGYCSEGKWNHGAEKQKGNKGSKGLKPIDPKVVGVPQKSLMGIPWRVAFALMDDEWILRNDIIWNKRSVMPESVKDRFTRNHEYLFMFTKEPKYFFDQDAVKEVGSIKAGTKAAKGSNKRSSTEKVNSRPPEYKTYSGTRNKRTVWTLGPEPYSEAHFATFPTKLVEPCILSGCPEDGVVLDPFMGSGTTLLTANRLMRKSIGIELNTDYIELAKKRLLSEPNPEDIIKREQKLKKFFK
jgi:DNA modification methylase